MIFSPEENEGIFAKIDDWSMAGARLIMDTSVQLPEVFYFQKLKRFEMGPPVCCKRMWQAGSLVGVTFLAKTHAQP